MTARIAYLPALDGLRAVAVISVVLYHLDLGAFPGGFLGVDLFFVISGYLITSLLLAEQAATGSIGLRSFWLRRFKRLVPSMVLMVGVTVLAARLWSVPQQWDSTRADAIAVLAYVANWHFIVTDVSYFDALLGPSPLRHMWSLAVEEQWYVLWPLAVVGLVAHVRRRRLGPNFVLVVVGVATTVSVVLMAVLYRSADPSRVYYGTDTRAQQLLIGAALAFAVARWPRLASVSVSRAGAVATAAALGALALVVATTDDTARWLYSGGFACVSLVCAVVVLAVSGPVLARPFRWLGARPLVWIGLRSYSIYLWHWPVIVFVGEPMGVELPPVPLAAVRIAVTVAIAAVVYQFVESPIRRLDVSPTRVVAVGTLAAIVVVSGAVFTLRAPASARLTDVDAIVAFPGDGATTTPTSPVAPASAPPGATDAPVPGPRGALLLGDSTALVLGVEHDPRDTPGWDIAATAFLGCGVVDGLPLDSDSDTPLVLPEHCATWREAWSDSVEHVRPDAALVMVGAWEVLDHHVDGVDLRFPTSEWTEAVRRGLHEAVGIAGQSGAEVFVFTLPCMRPDGDDNTTARGEHERVAAFNALVAEVVAETSTSHVLDVGEVLCPDGVFLEAVDGGAVRYDGVHLTHEGASVVWETVTGELDRVVQP